MAQDQRASYGSAMKIHARTPSPAGQQATQRQSAAETAQRQVAQQADGLEVDALTPREAAQRKSLNACFGAALQRHPGVSDGGTERQGVASGDLPIQRTRWLCSDDQWINPDTLEPIDQRLKPPEVAEEGDVWDDETGKQSSARARLNAIFDPPRLNPHGIRWLFSDGQWINPNTLEPIGPDLKPPQIAKEGDVWDERTGEQSAAHSRLNAIFAGKPTLEQRVKRAVAEVPTKDLTKTTVLASLEKHFADYEPGLHKATRDPAFSETLLECIRTRQSKNWSRATAPQQVPARQWTNQELQHWNVRHYTSKLNIALGQDLGEGIFTVADVEQPSFKEIISTVTLATMKPGGKIENAKRSGEKVMMTFTGGAASSGHTTGLDWANVGNVGDTFYGLFYKDQPATGITPPFITDAVYYAKWSVEDFGVGWASADWLGTAVDSQKEKGKTPQGIARTGQLSDIIASIFPEATTRDFSQSGEVEAEGSAERRKEAFAAMANFEIKKHGPMPVNAWLPIDANINKAKRWWINTTTGKFVKLKFLLPKSVQERL